MQSSASSRRRRYESSRGWVLGGLLALALLMSACTGSQVTRHSADEWFGLGQSHMARQKYGKAEEAFSKFLEQYPQDRRRPEALLGLADALYADKRYEEAKFQYRRFLELYPVHPEAAKAQFSIAMAAFHRLKTIDRDQSTTQEALQEFQRLVQYYPQSSYAAEAKEKIAACHEHLAAYELYVGRYYYKQGTFPAAISRFGGLLRMYPDVSFADEVLFLLGDAYLRSKQPQQAAGVFDELVKRYPQSSYANQAKARLASLQ